MGNPRTRKFETIQPGINVSSKRSTNGILGYLVHDCLNDNTSYILTNRHILAKGSCLETSNRRWAPIFQSGRIFKDPPHEPAGRLLQFNTEIDATIAPIVNRKFVVEQFGSGAILSKTRIPKVGDMVEKLAVRTGITVGRITKINNHQSTIRPLNMSKNILNEANEGCNSGRICYDSLTQKALVLNHTHEKSENPEEEFANRYFLDNILAKLKVRISAV